LNVSNRINYSKLTLDEKELLDKIVWNNKAVYEILEDEQSLLAGLIQLKFVKQLHDHLTVEIDRDTLLWLNKKKGH
jgi:hypothetical protein